MAYVRENPQPIALQGSVVQATSILGFTSWSPLRNKHAPPSASSYCKLSTLQVDCTNPLLWVSAELQFLRPTPRGLPVLRANLCWKSGTLILVSLNMRCPRIWPSGPGFFSLILTPRSGAVPSLMVYPVTHGVSRGGAVPSNCIAASPQAKFKGQHPGYFAGLDTSTDKPSLWRQDLRVGNPRMPKH